MNICLVEEKNYLFSTDCKSFKIKHDHLPGQRTADSAYLSSILAISTIPNYGFVKRQILLINQFVCTHTYMQYRHNHYYNKVSCYWNYCGVSLKFQANKIKYPGIIFIPNYICEQMCKHSSVTLFFLINPLLCRVGLEKGPV